MTKGETMNAREALNSMVEALEKMGFVILSRSEVAELRKALEQIEQQLDYGQIDMALHIARRVLEGLFGTLSGSDK
jgi:tetrahydromethanopterin S-methyltransferase subunit G